MYSQSTLSYVELPLLPLDTGPVVFVHKDVPLYPKYILTQETIQYLKKPTFDIWHWEPNEMLCLLEHMYNESLGQ